MQHELQQPQQALQSSQEQTWPQQDLSQQADEQQFAEVQQEAFAVTGPFAALS
ncbi:MAG TPA: hypothetical protein VHS31_06905 [Tepidisphaeraceae bacterium]|nr:hypothetical protein [Tepidisphaeraceae bacterium]